MRNAVLRCVLLQLALLASAIPMVARPPQSKPDPCKDISNMTQGQMNDCALKDLQNTELRMERLLRRLEIASDSPEQKAWETYRDAQLAAIYPPADISSYGSVYPMCLAILKKNLTEGRIRDLKGLTTSGEGDVCHGYQVAGRKNR